VQISIEEINQVWSLRTETMKTRIVILLPSGKKISAIIEDDDVATVLAALISETSAAKAPAQDDSEAVVEETPAPEEVIWMNLPDNYLAPQMKRMLQELGAAPSMSMPDLIALVHEVSRTDGLMEQVEQAAAPQVAGPPAPIQPVAVEEQKPGEVRTRRKPIRTVPKDENGYPVVPGMTQDPRDEISLDADEDGISSL
jgi:hypothetical protein